MLNFTQPFGCLEAVAALARVDGELPAADRGQLDALLRAVQKAHHHLERQPANPLVMVGRREASGQRLFF